MVDRRTALHCTALPQHCTALLFVECSSKTVSRLRTVLLTPRSHQGEAKWAQWIGLDLAEPCTLAEVKVCFAKPFGRARPCRESPAV